MIINNMKSENACDWWTFGALSGLIVAIWDEFLLDLELTHEHENNSVALKPTAPMNHLQLF